MRWCAEIMHSALPARTVSEDRLRGMLLGLAIGDSLGNTTEGQLPEDRRRRYGEIRNYLPNRYAGGRRVGLPSDDTQLAFWTLEHLLDEGHVEPTRLAQLFATRRIYGIGKTTRKFIDAICDGQPWFQASQPSAGNGAVTRVPAVVLPHACRGGSGMWRDVVLATAVTHNDPAAIATSVAFAGMLAELLTMSAAPEPHWWPCRFAAIAKEIEGDNRISPRGGPLAGQWNGPLWQFVEHHLPGRAGQSCVEASALWYSGAYLLETVPTALHILMRHCEDPEEAIVRAVNDTKDNDSIAGIVGAAVGALYGRRRLPEAWTIGLLGRTREDDDGRVFALMDKALLRFMPTNDA